MAKENELLSLGGKPQPQLLTPGPLSQFINSKEIQKELGDITLVNLDLLISQSNRCENT